MTLKAITQTIPAEIEAAKQLMAERADLYLAAGEFDTDEIPATFAEFLALFSGVTPPFKEFGAQAEGASTLEIEQETSKYFKGSQHKNWVFKATLNLNTLTESMISFLESNDYKGKVSVLVVPESCPKVAGDVSADNPATFFALSGISLTSKIKGGTGGDNPETVFTSENKAKTLGLILKYKQFTTAT